MDIGFRHENLKYFFLNYSMSYLIENSLSSNLRLTPSLLIISIIF